MPVRSETASGELVDVERERGFAARVEEAVDVAADVARELLADELFDGLDVAGLEPPHDGILEAEAELVEEALETLRHLRRALDRLLARVGDHVEPLAEVRGHRVRVAVAPFDDWQLAFVAHGGALSLAGALVEADDRFVRRQNGA